MLIAIIPLIVIAFYYDYISYNNTKETVSFLSNRIVNQTEVGINDRIKTMEKDLHMSVNNQDILDTFMNLPTYDPIKASFEEEKIRKHFDTIIYNTPYLDSIVIDLYDYETLTFGEGREDGNISETMRYLTSSLFTDSIYYEEAKLNTNEPIWISELRDNDNKIYLTKEFKYFMYARKMGVVTFVIDENMINDYIKTIGEVEIIGSNTVMDNRSKNIIVGDKISNDNLYRKNSETLLLDSEIETIESNNDLISYCTLINDWVLINLISGDIVFGGLTKARSNTIIFIVIGSIISLIASWIISKNTESKLSILISKFEKVEKGDFLIDRKIEDDNEYGIIEDHFNNMVNELDVLIKDNYLCSLEAKEAHLNALQYQINPHFLYNTLEVINSIAATYKAQEIREITQNLGSLFRYNISGSEVTTLDNEIKHIKNYIYLHQLHLHCKIEAFYDIEDEAKKAKILKFTIQPIIENIIKHAFNDRYSDGYIEINVEVRKNLRIIIRDDGCGISKEGLDELINKLSGKDSSIKKYEGGGIGLINIQERIKLNFGEEYGIEILSSDGNGTTISIEIPYTV